MALFDQVAEYLARAEEAEEQARKTQDPTFKQSFLNIAASYRSMAESRRSGAITRAVWTGPLPSPDSQDEPQK